MSFLDGARPLLAPLAPLYRAGWALQERRIRRGAIPVRRLRYPVISIGNLSVGGAGKTPTTIALARALLGRGWSVDVLSRGYGRRDHRAIRVRRDGTSAEFGDEPLVIAREAAVPVYVAAERYEAGMLAESDGGNARRLVHLLDDGFQHRQLYRDVDVVLLDGEDWRDRLLPAGNLREPLQALARASVLAIPTAVGELEKELRAWGWEGPVWQLARRMEIPEVDGPVAAFCGIARPEQFFEGLAAAGVEMATRTIFRDHHPYTDSDIRRLEAMACSRGATALVTTAKDAMRLQGIVITLPVKTAGLRVEVEDELQVLDWLAAQVDGAAAR